MNQMKKQYVMNNVTNNEAAENKVGFNKPKTVTSSNYSDDDRNSVASVATNASSATTSTSASKLLIKPKRIIANAEKVNNEVSKDIRTAETVVNKIAVRVHGEISKTQPIKARVVGHEEVSDESNQTFAQYSIEVEKFVGKEKKTWVVKKRYNHFLDLHEQLKVRYHELSVFVPPPKAMFSTVAVKERRKAAFNELLDLILKIDPVPVDFEDFLEVHKYGSVKVDRIMNIQASTTSFNTDKSYKSESTSSYKFAGGECMVVKQKFFSIGGASKYICCS